MGSEMGQTQLKERNNTQMEDSKMEKITSQMSKGSVLYVGSDALSLDGGSTPKVGDEVTVTGKVKSIEDKTVCIAPSLVGNEPQDDQPKEESVEDQRKRLTRAEVGDAITRARRKGGKAGTLYKPQTVKKLLKAVRDGLTLKQAAVACGIGETTLHGWKHSHPELIPMLEEARERARQRALETIWAARGDDWRAAESFLKYSYWQDYRTGNQVNVKQETNVAVAVPKTLTEEERMKLIEQREKSQRQSLQDQPKVIDAQVIEPEQAEPEPEQGTNRPPPGWVEQHEKVKQQAAINEKEQEEERLAEQRRRADAIRIRDLGF
jgi:hypothetical protein